MNIEQNKQVVITFLKELSASNVDAWTALLADDSTWWVGGKPDKFPLAGTMTKNQFVGLISKIMQIAPEGVQFTANDLTAEGDRVAVEATSYAETTSGKRYQNEYHFVFIVRDGKIHSVKEYLDTMHTKEIFLDT